mmetsp:Transcript_2774/g.5048  ORF Transcript_2774/g.5048 Transcript_2774/m.5048 type:complete len:81 (-) Transcript_2774:25-267(-)
MDKVIVDLKFNPASVRSTVGSSDQVVAGGNIHWYNGESGVRCEQYIIVRRQPTERYQKNIKRRTAMSMAALSPEEVTSSW